MKKNHRILISTFLATFLVIFLVALTGYFFAKRISTEKTNSIYDKQIVGLTYSYFTENDKNATYDLANSVYVSFNNDSYTYEIVKGGTYVLEGNLYGKIHIKTDDELVHLVLKGLKVKSAVGPALFVESASKVIMSLDTGTINEFRDSTEYDGYKNSKACIYSNCDLSVNGSGVLYVYGDYKDGIRTKDTFKAYLSDIRIRCKQHGIMGNDGVMLAVENIEIECEGNGIVSGSVRKNKGFVDIGTGKVRIIAGKRGIVSTNGLSIYSCSCDIYGVQGNIQNDGNIYIEEGCLINGY